jgi:hypothetical protein
VTFEDEDEWPTERLRAELVGARVMLERCPAQAVLSRVGFGSLVMRMAAELERRNGMAASGTSAEDDCG